MWLCFALCTNLQFAAKFCDNGRLSIGATQLRNNDYFQKVSWVSGCSVIISRYACIFYEMMLMEVKEFDKLMCHPAEPHLMRLFSLFDSGAPCDPFNSLLICKILISLLATKKRRKVCLTARDCWRLDLELSQLSWKFAIRRSCLAPHHWRRQRGHTYDAVDSDWREAIDNPPENDSTPCHWTDIYQHLSAPTLVEVCSFSCNDRSPHKLD